MKRAAEWLADAYAWYRWGRHWQFGSQTWRAYRIATVSVRARRLPEYSRAWLAWLGNP